MILFIPFDVYVGAYFLVWTGIAYSVLNLVFLFLCKMGFHLTARYLNFSWTCLIILISGQVLGVESLQWLYFLVFPSQSQFLSAPNEKIFRNYTYVVCLVALVVSIVLYVFKVVPTGYLPEHKDAVIYLGLYTGCYAGITLLVSIGNYQKEVALYKKRLEERSISMVQQAKMSTLGEMAAGVAHEINNPLGIILGKIEGWESRLGKQQVDNEKLVHDFSRIKHVVQRISKIVGALRTYAHNADNDPFVPAKSDEVITETLNLCEENLKVNHIEVRVTGETSVVFESRPVQISQCLVNLINNSFDAVRNLPEKWIEIHTEKLNDDKLRISVIDSGKGIAAEIAEKIMQPFFTTKEIGKGTGLGLSVTQGMVETQHGRLYLDRASANTKFVIELPLKQPIRLASPAPPISQMAAV